MKLKQETTKETEDQPLSTRIKSLKSLCPFKLEEFYEENKGTVKKFLRKNTINLEVPDWEDVPDSWYYKGQEGILRHGIKNKEYTILQKFEWIKCALDVTYITRKYVKIISIDEGIIPFRLYDYQFDLLRKYQDNRFVISLQARQSGKTQTTAAFILWFILFHQAKTCAVLANKGDQAQEILARVQLSYEMLPLFLQPGVKTYNKRSMVLSNESKAFSASSSSSSIRGKSIALLYIDECAFIPNDMEFYESTYPTIASGKDSRVIVSSTPNGTRGLFYKLWCESVEGKNEFKNLRVTWDMVPGRDQAWKNQSIANTSPEQFRQEHEVEFRGSQNSLLSGHTLESIPTKEPIEYMNDGSLKVFKAPEKGHRYVAVVDVSRGTGNDFHAISMIDLSSNPYEIVCTYRNNTLHPIMFPNLIFNVASQYNEALVLIEINDLGESVSNDLYYELEYENVLTVGREKNRQVISFGGETKTGVRTDQAVKSIGCANIKTMIERGNIIINDEVIVDEFGTFVPHGKSYAADSGCHDDMVMTLVLFGWLSTQTHFVDMTNSNFKTRVMKSMEERAMEEMVPFGIIDSPEFGQFDGNAAVDEVEPSMFGNF